MGLWVGLHPRGWVAVDFSALRVVVVASGDCGFWVVSGFVGHAGLVVVAKVVSSVVPIAVRGRNFGGSCGHL